MIGMATVDYLYVLDEHPQPDSVTRALDYRTVIGGVAGRAAITARRLGGPTRLLASCGDDVHAALLREHLGAEGVDCSWVVYDQPSQHSAVIVARDEATRTIIWLPQPMADSRMRSRLPEFLDGVDVVLLDATDEALAKAALDECERRGLVTVLDTGSGRPWTRDLLDRSRHVIAPEKYVARETGLAAEAAIGVLWRSGRHETLAVTQGPRGGVFAVAEDPRRLRRWRAAPVDAVDSNGAGDTFHGAYAWALARGMAPAECLDLAAWCAALKASQPGNAGIPTLEQLERARTADHARAADLAPESE
jgi:sugar/nucleoside kinase (ribokinase family)